MNEDQAGAIRAGESLDESALAAVFQTKIKDFEAIEAVKQFAGGFSNLTYLISTNVGDYVLRRPPFGAAAKGGHDMGREFRVLSQLRAAGFEAAPMPLFEDVLNEKSSVENTSNAVPFYVMERLKGVVLRANDAQNPNLSPPVMRQLCTLLIEQLAALHQIDLEKSGLIHLGKPEGYVLRQTNGWIERYQKSQTDSVADMETVANWLRENQPRAQNPAFLHNDFKFDNVVLRESLDEIVGILDWEMATVGDPLMDLGATLAYWCENDDAPFLKMFNLTWLPGCLTRREVVSLYAELTGRDVADILFYYVFGLYKNAVIVQQIYARWKKGATQDARFSQLIKGVYALSQTAKRAIEGKIK